MKRILFLIFLLVQKLMTCPNDINCQQCDNDNACTYCVYSYPNESGVCVPANTIPGCYSYSNINTCMACEDGYYQSPENLCHVLDRTIAQVCRFSYTSTNYCDVCYNFTLSENGSCKSDLRCSDINCDACWISNIDGLEYCFECFGKYVIWANTTGLGVACFRSGFLNGCFSGKMYNMCNNCNLGFYWQNGRCLVNNALLLPPIVVIQKVEINAFWALVVFLGIFNFEFGN